MSELVALGSIGALLVDDIDGNNTVFEVVDEMSVGVARVWFDVNAVDVDGVTVAVDVAWVGFDVDGVTLVVDIFRVGINDDGITVAVGIAWVGFDVDGVTVAVDVFWVDFNVDWVTEVVDVASVEFDVDGVAVFDVVLADVDAAVVLSSDSVSTVVGTVLGHLLASGLHPPSTISVVVEVQMETIH